MAGSSTLQWSREIYVIYRCLFWKDDPLSGDEVTSLINIVPHSRAWHLATHSLTF